MEYKLLKNTAAILLSQSEHIMHMDELTAILGALALRVDDASDMPATLKSVLKLKKGRSGLKTSNMDFAPLCDACLQKWVNTLKDEQKRDLLTNKDCGLKLIGAIEVNGFISLTTDQKLGTYRGIVSDQLGKPLSYYVWPHAWYDSAIAAIVPSTESAEEATDFFAEQQENNAENNSTAGPSTEESIPYEEVLGIYENLYDTLTKDDKSFRLHCKYSWQWRLTESEYQNICDCFKVHEFPSKAISNKAVQASPSHAKKLAFLAMLRMAEFYKREYHDENRSCPLKLHTEQRRQVARLLNIPIYRGNGDNAEDSNEAVLYSIYAEGGLPLYYIYQTKNSTFITVLAKLTNPENELELIEGEFLLERYFNVALKGSYIDKKSVYEYLQYVRDGKRIWNESDDENPACIYFKELRDTLNRERANRRNKFRLVFHLWQYQDYYGVQPEVHLRSAVDGEYRYLVPSEMARKWGVEDLNSFEMQVTDEIVDSQPQATLMFVRNVNGDYIERKYCSSFHLASLVGDNLKWENILLAKCHIQIENDGSFILDITKQFRNFDPQTLQQQLKNGYLQLYTNDDANATFVTWTSNKGTTYFIRSALIFNPDLCQVQETAKIRQISSTVCFVEFTNAIVIRINNKSEIIYNHRRNFYITPKPSALHSICKNSLLENMTDQGCIEVVRSVSQEKDSLFFVKSHCEFDIKQSDNNECLNSDLQDLVSLYYIDSAGQKIKFTGVLPLGYVKIQAEYDRYVTSVNCYVLPEEANIYFEYNNNINRIRFSHFSAELISSVDNHFYINRISDTDCICYANGEQTQESTEISFTLDSGSYARIQIPNPREHIFGYVANYKFTGTLLMSYADMAQLRYYSYTGCKDILLKDYYKRLFLNLVPLNGQEINPLQQIKTNSIPSELLTIRIYTHIIPEESCTPNTIWGFIDFSDDSVYEQQTTNPNAWAKSLRKEGLLFQSHKSIEDVTINYAPQYISSSKLPHKSSTEIRINRLKDYAKSKEEKYCSSSAIAHFELASEHRLYFGVFDTLVSLVVKQCEDRKKKDDSISSKEKMACVLSHNIDNKKIFKFLQSYSQYIKQQEKPADITGLIRLSREFLFDWECLKPMMARKKDLLELNKLYQELIKH